MTTVLVRKIEETTLVEGEEVKKVTGLEKQLINDKGNIVGSISVNQWGANISTTISDFDAQAFANYIEQYFTELETI